MISITDNLKKDFCVECRKETGYSLQIRDYTKLIKDKNYNFEITTAVCSEALFHIEKYLMQTARVV